MAHKDLVKHDEEKTNEHLLLMKSALIDTQNKLADMEKQLTSALKKLEANYTEMLAAKVEAQNQSKSETVLQYRISELEASLQQKTKLIDMVLGDYPIMIHTRAPKLSFDNQLL